MGGFLSRNFHVRLTIIPQFLRLIRSENVTIFSRSIAIQVVGYGLSLCLMPIAVAFYTPAQFGMFAVALFAANLIGTYGGSKLEWALINERSGRAADLLMKFSLTLIVLWGALAALAALFAPAQFFLHFNLHRSAALLAALVAVSVGSGLILQAAGIRAKSYQNVYLSRNGVMVSRQLIQIGLGLAWPSVTALLVSEIASRFIGVAIILNRLQRRIELLSPRRFTRLFGPLALRRYGHYSKVGLPSSLVNFLMTEGLAVVIVPLYGLDVAGAFWLVQRIFGIPIALIGTVVADVFQGQIARRTDYRMIFQVMLQLGGLLAGFSVTVLPAAAVAFWGLTEHLYGGKWQQSGQFALYLIPAICLQFIASPLSRIFIVREKMNYKYIFDGTMFVGLAVWLTLTWVLGLSAYQSIACLAGAQSIAYGLYIALSFHVGRLA